MGVELAIRLQEFARCFSVMRKLRPALKSEDDFMAQVTRQQAQGYELAFLEHAGEVVTVAGFRVQPMLSSALTLYVDDLVTADAARSQGERPHDARVADRLRKIARLP